MTEEEKKALSDHDHSELETLRSYGTPRIVFVRALVVPGRGDTSGLWFPCVRYVISSGIRGLTILGGYPMDWDAAARTATHEVQNWSVGGWSSWAEGVTT